MDLRKNKHVFVNQSKNQLKTKRKIESQLKKNKTVLLKKNILKIVGHNSGPTQEQNVFGESIKELVRNKNENISTVSK